MDFKKLGKRLLGIVLALVMAVPVVAFTPPVTVEAAVNLMDFAPGRSSITVNGLTATATAFDPATGVMEVEVSGTAEVLNNGRYLVYARAGTGPNTENVAIGNFNQTRDASPITTFRHFTHDNVPNAPFTLEFGAGVTPGNVRLYIGLVTTSGDAGFVNPDAAEAGATVPDILTINGMGLTASHEGDIGSISLSTLSFELEGVATQSGNYRIWFTQDSTAWGGVNPPVVANFLQMHFGQETHGPWSMATHIPSAFNINEGTELFGDYTLRGSWHQNMRVPTRSVIRVEFTPPAPIPVDVDFFYLIDYVNEMLVFGNTFTVWDRPQVDALGRPMVDEHGNLMLLDTPLHEVNRSDISYIFNRRADRINPNRGNWITTWTGEADISRHARRGGYIGVRRRLPNNTFEMIAVIPIQARPVHRYIRRANRALYLPTILTADGALPQNSDRIRNPLDDATLWPATNPGEAPDLEIRIGDDRRRLFGGNGVVIRTDRVAPGEYVEVSHDMIPRGTRGTFRIAPNEAQHFVNHNHEVRFIRDLLGEGVTYVPGYGDLQEILDRGGSFASQIVRFRIPNQPNAPAVARMLVTPGRNGQAFFVSRTNQHMRVWAYAICTDDTAPTYGTAIPAWRPITPNIHVQNLINLFEGQPLPVCPVNPANYSFEIRIFRNNRIVSAPGFFSPSIAGANGTPGFVDSTNMNATLGAIVVTGTQNDQLGTTAAHARNGFTINISTAGGTIIMPATNAASARNPDATNRAAVESWFVNEAGVNTLPAGLRATLTRSGANAQIIVHGTPTAAANDVPISLLIPASAVQGDNAVRVINPPVSATDSTPRARFNIAPDPDAATTAYLTSITSPAALSMTLAEATAGNWAALDLPTTVVVNTTSHAAATINVPVTWNPAGNDFDAASGAPQTFLIPGTASFADLPLGINNAQNLPPAVWIPVNVTP
ncbi:MAG: hypothetical protein FWF77_03810 [Defluviitaleaceae bacterium]|nr:hypothetical protein [Defluviitaleaceae bacterium]